MIQEKQCFKTLCLKQFYQVIHFTGGFLSVYIASGRKNIKSTEQLFALITRDIYNAEYHRRNVHSCHIHLVNNNAFDAHSRKTYSELNTITYVDAF